MVEEGGGIQKREKIVVYLVSFTLDVVNGNWKKRQRIGNAKKEVKKRMKNLWQINMHVVCVGVHLQVRFFITLFGNKKNKTV